jgi:multicomponent Na+:H+ antiporter subunit E
MQKFYRYIRRLLLLSGLWWILAGADPFSWFLGGAVILLVGLWRLDGVGVAESKFRLWRLAWFVPCFLWRTVVGSCDVAWRAVHWRMPITPTTLSYPFRLPPHGSSRVVFANCLSLSPGTLAVEMQEDVLLVHVIAEGPEATAAVRQLESEVAWTFGCVFGTPEGGTDRPQEEDSD